MNKMFLSVFLAVFSLPSHAGIKGIFTRAQVLTSPVAVSMGTQEGVSETEAKMKAKEEAEHLAIMMTTYGPKDRADYPYDTILRAVGETCKNSNKLQMEGEKITYDFYTSLADGNSYVQAILTFKYKCPELSRP